MQQQVDSTRHAKNPAHQEDGQTGPIDRSPERGNTEQLDRDAAYDHHLYDVNGVIDEVKQQGATQRREGKPGDTRNC
jgi:hypothetical protein